MAFCRACSKEIGDDVANCTHCGAHQLFHSTVNSADGAASNQGIGYFDVLKKYAVFTGRARRKEYWMFFLVNFLVSLALGVVGGIIGDKGIITNIFSIAVLLPGIAVGVRRLHDTDRSGWWLIVPIANFIFLVSDGHPGPNRFGPSPK